VKPDQLNRRFYALDALRAIMMLLGLVIHTGVTYMPHESPVRTVMAKETWIGFFPVINLIHSFRMPVFFIVAGYFGALLFFRKGPLEMLQNRVLKILLPLIAGVLILYPIIYFSFIFSSARIAGDPSALDKAWQSIQSGSFLPYRLSHLWFLYDLMLFSIASSAIAWLFHKATSIQSIVNRIARYILVRPFLRIVLVAILFYIGLLINKEYTLHTNVSFWIDRNLLYCYFLFYLIGWMVYRTDLLYALQWNPLLQLVIALVLFCISMYIELEVTASWTFQALQMINAMVTSLMTFGVIAWFLTYCNAYSKAMAYIMDAADFVYLIHVPISIVIPGLLANSGLHPILQFFITISCTITICFGVYHLMVRKSFIGKFLNGKLFSFPVTGSEKIKAIP
jgi:glucans biosynthesis protein C